MPRITIYLPDDADPEAHNILQEGLAEKHGGFTLYGGRGAWVDGDGELIGEDVHVYEALADGDHEDVYNDTDLLIRDVFLACDQDAVMGAVDGEKILITG